MYIYLTEYKNDRKFHGRVTPANLGAAGAFPIIPVGLYRSQNDIFLLKPQAIISPYYECSR